MQATKIENEYFRNFVMTINAEGTKELYKFIFKKYTTFVNGNIMPDNPKNS